MPEAADADNELKNIVGVRDNDESNTKKRKRNKKNTLWNMCDKNINIACLYYLWLSVARVDKIIMFT